MSKIETVIRGSFWSGANRMWAEMSRLEKLVCDSCGKVIAAEEAYLSLEKRMGRRKYEQVNSPHPLGDIGEDIDFCSLECMEAWASRTLNARAE